MHHVADDYWLLAARENIDEAMTGRVAWRERQRVVSSSAQSPGDHRDDEQHHYGVCDDDNALSLFC
jgi:hypothetical protein